MRETLPRAVVVRSTVSSWMTTACPSEDEAHVKLDAIEIQGARVAARHLSVLRSLALCAPVAVEQDHAPSHAASLSRVVAERPSK